MGSDGFCTSYFPIRCRPIYFFLYPKLLLHLPMPASSTALDQISVTHRFPFVHGHSFQHSSLGISVRSKTCFFARSFTLPSPLTFHEEFFEVRRSHNALFSRFTPHSIFSFVFSSFVSSQGSLKSVFVFLWPPLLNIQSEVFFTGPSSSVASMTIMRPQLQPLVLLTSLHSPSCLCQLLGGV